MMILGVTFEVLVKFIDTGGEEGNLDFRAAGVRGSAGKFTNDFSFFVLQFGFSGHYFTYVFLILFSLCVRGVSTRQVRV
jgi:hypothetical protein